MRTFLHNFSVKIIVFILLFVGAGGVCKASHIIGCDLYYTHTSGNTYQVTLVVYGDCGGSAFPGLVSSTYAVITVSDVGSSYTPYTINLSKQAPTGGVEVTPVCASQLSNTTCNSATGTITGVKKFVFQGTTTLSHTSQNWLFRFCGVFNPTAPGGGRTAAINTITSGTIIALEAKLNNSTNGANSNPVFTTIPTPFFCINQAQNYNPGAVDPDGDSLVVSLVPGLTPANNCANTPGNVIYSTGTYAASATSPFSYTAGSFNFNSATGQLSFTPNLIEIALVVQRVSEYRNGTFVGSTMREMNFVIINCSNTPPSGGLSSIGNGGTILDSTDASICKSTGIFTAHIYPTDPNGNNIKVTYAGVPAGMTFTVTNDSTTAPNIYMNWNLTNVTPGTYTIFITYTNDACPQKAHQTLAYTIIVYPSPTLSYSQISLPSCSKKAIINVTPGSPGPSPYSIQISANPVHYFTNVTGTQVDSLSPGTYTIAVRNGNTCEADTTITIAPPPAIYPTVTITPPTCYNGTNGSIVASAYGGLAPFQYAIDFGSVSSTSTFSGLISGYHNLRVYDANNCFKDTSIYIPIPPDINIAIYQNNVLCNGQNNGSITAVASNTTAPYLYAFNFGSATSANTFSNLVAGAYNVHVIDAHYCTKDVVVTITQPQTLVLAASVTNVSCYGGNNGTITYNASGGTLAYLYSLNGGAYSSSTTVSGLTAGTYYLAVKDNNGCLAYDTVTITQPTPLGISAIPVQPLCHDSSNGYYTITGSGGTPSYKYALGAGAYSTTNIFGGLAIGTYTFHVKDSLGCIKDTTVTLAQPTRIIPSITLVSPTCNNGANGTVSVIATGGTPTYTYAFNSSTYINPGNFSGISAGTAIVHTKDSHGCIIDTSVTFINPPPILANFVFAEPPCNHFPNGSITVSGYNSTGPYTYALDTSSTFQNSSTFTGLYSGFHTVHIKNSVGCIKDTTVQLPDSVRIYATVPLVNILCNGDSTGTITVNAVGAYPPYTYSININPYNNTFSYTMLPAGTYSLHVRDTKLCYFDTVVTLTQPPLIVFTTTQTNVLCFGGNNASINLNTTGGVTPYKYSLNNAAYVSATSFNNLFAGVYNIKIKDTNNCVKQVTDTITQPTKLKVSSIIFHQPNCFGDANGYIVLNGTGGVTPYRYAIGAGPYAVVDTFANLIAGNYTLHLRDTNLCVVDTAVTLAQPTAVNIQAQRRSSTCATLHDGRVILKGGGGTPSYTYAIQSNSYVVGDTFSNLSAGTYTFHVRDSHGCQKDTTITINDSLVIHVTAIISPAVCYNEASGSIMLSGYGGTSPYQYALGFGSYSNTNTFPNLFSNTYAIHVRDTNGCILDSSVFVSQPTNIVPSVALTQPACYGGSDGTIVVSAIGGTLGLAYPYTYAVGAGAYQNTGTFNNLATSTYTFHVKDGHNCLHDTTVFLGQPTRIAYGDSVDNVKCFGGNTGVITPINVHGGTPPYVYAHDGSAYSTTPSQFGLIAGNHIIHVQDNHGCIVDTTVYVGQPAKLYFGPSVIKTPTCEGYKDGVITVYGIGGIKPYLYSKDGGPLASINTYIHLPENVYSFTVQDSNLCQHDTTINLVGYPHIVIAGADVRNVSCYDFADGHIYLNVTGGNPSLIYQATYFQTPRPLPRWDSLGHGTYTIKITDSTGCVKDTTIVISMPEKLRIAVEVTPNECAGADLTSALSAVVTGGTSPYSYLWSTKPLENTQTVTKLPNGRYFLYVHDAQLCQDSTDAIVPYDNCCIPFVPSAFTPNGDGKNDIYKVSYKGDMTLLNFSIYNRFGQRVFFTTDMTQGWDGNWNGVQQDLGTYFYYIKATCGYKKDNVVEFKGDLTLIR